MNKQVKRINKKNAWVHAYENGALFLISYCTPVAAYIPGLGWLRTTTKFSQTTSKQTTQWLGSHGHPQTIPAEQREIENWFQKLDGLIFNGEGQ